MEKLITDFTTKMWNVVASKVQKAAVFMDNACAECLHWCGGTEVLFEGGALNIREFSAFESGLSTEERAVFIVSTPLTGKTAKTIEDILKSSRFSSCVVITSADVHVHEFVAKAKGPHVDVFKRFESVLLRWMSTDEGTAKAFHLPIFVAPMFDNLFITPAFDTIFPVQEKDLINLELQEGERPPANVSDLHFYMLPVEYQTMVKLVVTSIRGFFHAQGCKEDVFALGSTSHAVSVQLSNLVGQSKTAYPRHASVLFIDRTLDLIGPSSHIKKSVVDRLLSILPALSGHSNNISIDMADVCASNADADGEDIVYPGCLASHNSSQSDNLVLSDVYKLETKEAVKKIRQCLSDAIEEEGLMEEVDAGSVGDEIEDLVKLFRQNAGAILYNSNLLQMSLAVAQMIKDPAHKVWDSLATTEKLLLQQLGDDDSFSVISRILNLIEDSEESNVTFDDVAALLVYSSHVFHDGTDKQQVDKLIDALCTMLAKTPSEELPEAFAHLSGGETGSEADAEVFRDIVCEMVENLNLLNLNQLQHFKVLKLSDIEPTSYQPLLGQVMERILRPEKLELEPDIEHISTGRKDLLKMGISMFKKITPPRPNDHPLLMIYVLGGITATEVHQVNQVIDKYRGDCRVILGSNRLISSTDIADRTLFANNLDPDL